jgi:Ran GTPase-activating protein (RanGAP) involved in mRNA processing and transport
LRCFEISEVRVLLAHKFSYPHAKTFCLWKTFCEDEGVRAVVQCLTQLKSVFKVDLLDNKITALGCEFVSTLIHPKSNCNIEILKLDHNEFGSAGMIALSEGLAICKTLKNLSLTYCNIDAAGARAIFEILIYSQSKKIIQKR